MEMGWTTSRVGPLAPHPLVVDVDVIVDGDVVLLWVWVVAFVDVDVVVDVIVDVVLDVVNVG